MQTCCQIQFNVYAAICLLKLTLEKFTSNQKKSDFMPGCEWLEKKSIFQGRIKIYLKA